MRREAFVLRVKHFVMQILCLTAQQLRTMPSVDMQLNQGKFEAGCPIARRDSSVKLSAEAGVAPPVAPPFCAAQASARCDARPGRAGSVLLCGPCRGAGWTDRARTARSAADAARHVPLRQGGRQGPA
ncbi:hypothetical protein, partial [Burkholderia glumae]|uniref:hypothetical protein n=1 Tax=Burkholderia glumae TaxID=337 RepID=UPI0019D709A2